MTRREAAQAVAMTALSYSRILGANDRVGLGLIGAGGRGSAVTQLFQGNPEVELRALCDVYPVRMARLKQTAPEAKTFGDHHELLALKEVDVVLVASPDHWHKDHACDAMNAGKDVYSEKPMCRLRSEAPEMLRTARVTGRICQIGIQQRSGEIYIEAKEKYVASGVLGKVTHVDALWQSNTSGPLPKEPAVKPPDLDWIRFLGPVRYRDWSPSQYLNFRAFLDFNGGKMTDFGHHSMDVVHMFMGERAPHSAVFAGGIYLDRQDGRTAPDTCNALFEYDGFSVLFQSSSYVGSEYGVTFYSEKGKLFVNRNRYEFTPAGRGAKPEGRSIPGDITSDHVRNFLDCCKSRKLPNGDAGVASISILPPLLAVQSYLERRRLNFDPERLEVFPL